MINFIVNLFSKNKNRQRDVAAVATSTAKVAHETAVKPTQDQPVEEVKESLRQADVVMAKIVDNQDVQLRVDDDDMVHLRQKAMPRDSGNFSVNVTEHTQSIHLESINRTEDDFSECESVSVEIDSAMENRISKDDDEKEVLDLNSEAQTRFVSSFLSERRPQRNSCDSVESMEENEKLSNINSEVVNEILEDLNESKKENENYETQKNKLVASLSVEEYIAGHKAKEIEREQKRKKFEEKKKRVSENLDEFLNIHAMNQLNRMGSSLEEYIAGHKAKEIEREQKRKKFEEKKKRVSENLDEFLNIHAMNQLHRMGSCNGYEEIEYIHGTDTNQSSYNDLAYAVENNVPEAEEHIEESVECAPIDGYNEVLKMTQMLDKFVEDEKIETHETNLKDLNSEKEVEEIQVKKKSTLTPSEELKNFVAKMPEICYKREREMYEQLIKRHDAEVELKRFLTIHKANQLRRMQSVPAEVIKLERFIDNHACKTLERANSLKQVEESWSKAKDLLIPYLENYQHKVEETYNIAIKEDEEEAVPEEECFQKEQELNNFKGELAEACKTTIDDVLQVTQRELEKTSVPTSPTDKQSDVQSSDEEDVIIDHSGEAHSFSLQDVIGIDKGEITKEELSQMCDEVSELEMIDELNDEDSIEKKVQFDKELSLENGSLEVDEIVKFRSTPYSEPYTESEDQEEKNNHVYENIAQETLTGQVLRNDEDNGSSDTSMLNEGEMKSIFEMQQKSQMPDIIAEVEGETNFNTSSDESLEIVEQIVENQQAVITSVTATDSAEQNFIEKDVALIEVDEMRTNSDEMHTNAEIDESDIKNEAPNPIVSQKSIHEELAESMRKDEEEEQAKEKASVNNTEDESLQIDSTEISRQETSGVDIIESCEKVEEIIPGHENIVDNINEVEEKSSTPDVDSPMQHEQESIRFDNQEVSWAEQQPELNRANSMTGSMITEIAEAPEITDSIIQIPAVTTVQEINISSSPYGVIADYINSRPLETDLRKDEMNISMITHVSEQPEVEPNQSDFEVSDSSAPTAHEEKVELEKMKSIHEEMAEINEIQPLDNQINNHHWEKKASRDDLTLDLNDDSPELLNCQVVLESPKGVLLRLGSTEESKLPEKLANKMKRTLSHEKSVEEIEYKLNRAESRRKEYQKHCIKHAVIDLERCQRIKNERVTAQ